MVQAYPPEPHRLACGSSQSLGSSILDLIVPSEGYVRAKVPIDMEWGGRVSTDGVLDKDIIMKQLEATFTILDEHGPDRVLVLGGECAVSVAPFTWMAGRLDGYVAMIWTMPILTSRCQGILMRASMPWRLRPAWGWVMLISPPC